MTPINATDIQIFARRNANETPTANASMLVATAIAHIVLKEKSELPDTGSFEKDSLTMFPPMMDRRTKAIQWSKLVMKSILA